MKSGFSFSSRLANHTCLLIIGAAVFVAMSSACSPNVMPREFAEPRTEFGPARTDGELPLDEVKMNSTPTAASVRWKGDIDTAAWYRASEDLGWLSRTLSIRQLGKFSFRMRRAVANSSVAWDHTFSNSAYASAAIGETRDDTRKSIDEAVAMLTAQEPTIATLLLDRSQRHAWPTGEASLVTVVEHVEQFLIEFVRDVERSSVDKAVKKQLVEELRINFGPRVQRIRTQVALAYNLEKTYDFVARIRAILKEEQVNLGPEINQQLDLAERLPREVERISNAKNALSVLVDFWLAASPETRIGKFKTMAPELYDFFNDQSAEDLDCIKTGCGLFTRIKRALFILPKVEEYGVDKIRAQLSRAAEETIKSELEIQAVRYLPGLYKEIQTKITEELSRQKGNITKIATDYGSYLRLVFNRVAIAKFGLKEKDLISGSDPNRIRVDIDFSGAGLIQAQRIGQNVRDGFHTGAATLGAGIAAAVEVHDFHLENEMQASGANPIRVKQALGRIFFEQINKVLMVGGFKAESSKPFEALSIALDGDIRRNGTPARFNLRTLLSSETSFAVPDDLVLLRPAKPDLVVASVPPKNVSVSVGAQAELLRGLSRLALSLRDWQGTSFDKVLGPINLADFVPDLPREAVDQKLFPKDLFYAATIGNAGAILQNMTKKLSTVGLIEPGRGMHWGNEKDPATDPTQQAFMATVFDFVNGARSLQAKTVDVARFLSAVTEFLRASEGVEKTRAEVLLKADKNGQRPVDQLIAARQDLKLLVMAIANFLSSEAIGVDGVVLPIFSRSAENKALGMSGEPRLGDQAATIRALLDASEILSAGVYRSAALDLMSATNTSFFSRELAFYSERKGANESLTLESVSGILIAGERLAPYMTKERAGQWVRASRPWINALRDAADRLP